MKKSILYFGCALSVLLSCSYGSAKEWENNNKELDRYLSVQVGSLSPDQGEIKPAVIGGIEAGLARKFYGIALGAMYYKGKLNTGSTATDNDTIALAPLMITPYLQHQVNVLSIPVNLRAGGGVGYVAAGHTLETSATTRAQILNLTIESVNQTTKKIEGAPSFHLRGGFDVPINDKISIGTDATYLWFKPKQTVTSKSVQKLNGQEISSTSTETSSDIGMNSWLLTVAVKYHF